MKQVFIALVLILSLLSQPPVVLGKGRSSRSSSGRVHVKGYYRKDGTYVRPHTRSYPGSGVSVDSSTRRDMVNPYVGQSRAAEQQGVPPKIHLLGPLITEIGDGSFKYLGKHYRIIGYCVPLDAQLRQKAQSRLKVLLNADRVTAQKIGQNQQGTILVAVFVNDNDVVETLISEGLIKEDNSDYSEFTIIFTHKGFLKLPIPPARTSNHAPPANISDSIPVDSPLNLPEDIDLAASGHAPLYNVIDERTLCRINLEIAVLQTGNLTPLGRVKFKITPKAGTPDQRTFSTDKNGLASFSLPAGSYIIENARALKVNDLSLEPGEWSALINLRPAKTYSLKLRWENNGDIWGSVLSQSAM